LISYTNGGGNIATISAAFPVARQDTLIVSGSAQMNADQIRDLLAAIRTARPRAALGMPLTQAAISSLRSSP